MQLKSILQVGLATMAWVTAVSSEVHTVNNNAPIVTITSPLNNSRVQWNSTVPYSIRVLDKEDGNSEYDEISSREVFLWVTYYPDSSIAKRSSPDALLENKESLVWMSTSTCFNCHASKDKLIGPSFESIAQRYSTNRASIELLARKIIAGTSGSWGDVKMPPHPDMKLDKATELVKWILDNSLDPDKTFYLGIEGSFRTRDKPDKATGKGMYILTATYTDHGLNGIYGSNKRSAHTIVLRNY